MKTKPIVKQGFLLSQCVPGDEYNFETPDRVEMDEEEAKKFIERNPSYTITQLPVILGYEIIEP